MRKLTAWARLSVEGKRAWGDVFPDGRVPIQSITTQCVKLDGIRDAESVFAVNWKELSKEQQECVLEKTSEQTCIPKETVLQEILTVGFFIRRGFFVSFGTTHADSFT